MTGGMVLVDNLEERLTNKREEYQATQEAYLHYDSFRWQAGSFLTAGVFVFWGLVVSQAKLPPRIIATGATLVALLMSAWVLFAHHYRQLYLCKLARIHEIEEELGMEQHRRFIGNGVDGIRYRSFGPRGHNLDLFVYALTSLTGSALGIAQGPFTPWLLVPLPIVGLVTGTIFINERRIKRLLRQLAASRRAGRPASG